MGCVSRNHWRTSLYSYPKYFKYCILSLKLLIINITFKIKYCSITRQKSLGCYKPFQAAKLCMIYNGPSCTIYGTWDLHNQCHETIQSSTLFILNYFLLKTNNINVMITVKSLYLLRVVVKNGNQMLKIKKKHIQNHLLWSGFTNQV